MRWVKAFLGVLSVLVLAAILFPVFAKARSGSFRNPCFSRLFTIGRASEIYLADNADHFPLANRWTEALAGPVAPASEFGCPSALTESPTGFAMNSFLSGVKQNSIEVPAEAHYIYDSSLLEHNAHEYVPTYLSAFRHRGPNVLFADLHAKHIGQRKK